MRAGHWVAELFAAVDRKDVDGFAAFLAEDCVFRFGNAAPVAGREAVGGAVADFLASLQAISHELSAVVEADGQIACHGTVCYVRPDAGQSRYLR